MKRLVSLLIIAVIFASCQKDDGPLVSQCLTPTDFAANNVSSNSAYLSWTDFNESASFIVEYGFSGFTIGTGTTLVTTTTNITLIDLIEDTSYDAYIKADCSTTNFSIWSQKLSFTTSMGPVISEFRTNLSELNLFSGTLKDLILSPNVFEYKLVTPLFTDYAHKQRLIALPPGESMQFNGDGLPVFPDNTLIAKTFYYNNDERDPSLGRNIIETRILIKTNGEWETGDYKWNEAQSDAVLDLQGSDVPVSWIDANGTTTSLTYQIPSNTDCFTCHNTSNNITPIGPKLRTLNFEINGVNQLERFISNQQLSGVNSSSEVSEMPDWSEDSFQLENRARAYMDVNCAHCHMPGGFCENESTLNLAYETSFEDSDILNRKSSISNRISTYNPGVSMPFIGTSTIHIEGVALLQEYLDSL